MPRFIQVLLLLFLVPGAGSAQMEKAFESPQPRRIRVLEKMREPEGLYHDVSKEIRFYSRLKEEAEKAKDPQTRIYAEAWLNSAKIRMDSAGFGEYVTRQKALVDQSMSTGNEILQEQVLIILVDDLRLFHRNGASLSYYILADSIMQRLGPDATPREDYNLKHDLILELYSIGDYKRAKEIMDGSAGMNIRQDFQLYFADLHSQILLQLQQYDSSAYYINKAQHLLDNDPGRYNREGWYGILEGNMAKILYYKKEYASAIPSFIKAMEITYQAQLLDNTATFGLLLAQCYLQTQEPEKIVPLMPVIREAVYHQNKDEYYIDLYRLMLALPDPNRTTARSMQLLDSIDWRQQQFALWNDRNLLTRHEMETELTTYQQRQARLDAEIQRQLFWRNLLWLALGCIVIITMWLVYRGNRRFRNEQDRSKKIQELAQQELAASREQLRLFTATLQEKSRQIEWLESNIDVGQQNETLEQLRRNTILTEDEWSRFRSLFEKAHPGFFTRAQLKLPGLTTGELRFVALVKLSFTTREMAATLGISPVSVRSIRSRLLKKLNLPESENFGQMISAL